VSGVRRLGALALVVLLGGATSCGSATPKYVDFSDAKRNFRPTDYEQVLQHWTRHTKAIKIYAGTIIEAWSTYKSWEFRQAYIERYASVYGLSEAERTALFNSQKDAARQTFEFHVAVQTTSYKWNDLDKDTSAWRVSLVDGTGAEIAPRRIERLRLPELYEAQFFPYRTEFTTTYLIRFNRMDAEAAGFAGPGSGRLTLRVASPVAKGELVWEAR
jgi:hypothetical protein